MQLAEVETRARHGGCGGISAGTDKIKPPKFNGSTYWIQFHCQFEAMAEHSNWADRENVEHTLAVLQELAFDVLRIFPTEERHKDLIRPLKLSAIWATYWQQCTFRCWKSDLIDNTKSSLPPSTSWPTLLLHAFINSTRGREMKLSLLILMRGCWVRL